MYLWLIIKIIVDINKSKYRDYYNSEILYLKKDIVKEEIIRKINIIFAVLNHKNEKTTINA